MIYDKLKINLKLYNNVMEKTLPATPDPCFQSQLPRFLNFFPAEIKQNNLRKAHRQAKHGSAGKWSSAHLSRKCTARLYAHIAIPKFHIMIK